MKSSNLARAGPNKLRFQGPLRCWGVRISTSGAATGEKEQKLLAGLLVASHQSASAKAKSRFTPASGFPETLQKPIFRHISQIVYEWASGVCKLGVRVCEWAAPLICSLAPSSPLVRSLARSALPRSQSPLAHLHTLLAHRYATRRALAQELPCFPLGPAKLNLLSGTRAFGGGATKVDPSCAIKRKRP